MRQYIYFVCVSHDVLRIVRRYRQWLQDSVCTWALTSYASVLQFQYVRAEVELQASITGCCKGFECSLQRTSIKTEVTTNAPFALPVHLYEPDRKAVLQAM